MANTVFLPGPFLFNYTHNFLFVKKKKTTTGVGGWRGGNKQTKKGGYGGADEESPEQLKWTRPKRQRTKGAYSAIYPTLQTWTLLLPYCTHPVTQQTLTLGKRKAVVFHPSGPPWTRYTVCFQSPDSLQWSVDSLDVKCSRCGKILSQLLALFQVLCSLVFADFSVKKIKVGSGNTLS